MNLAVAGFAPAADSNLGGLVGQVDAELQFHGSTDFVRPQLGEELFESRSERQIVDLEILRIMDLGVIPVDFADCVAINEILHHDVFKRRGLERGLFKSTDS